MKKDNFGIIALVCAIILFVIAIILYVMPLPYKLDTIIVVCWVFGPAIVGSIIYCIIEGKNGWRQDTPLK